MSLGYNLIYACLFAAFAVVWTEVLTAPGMVFGWLDRIIHDNIRAEWLLKPLGDCVYCFGGQVALWGFLLINKGGYDWLTHALFVSTTIFIIHIYCKVWN